MLCLFALSMVLSAWALPPDEKKVTLDLKDVPMETFLNTVKQKAGINMLYNSQMFKGVEPVTVKATNEPWKELLDRVLSPKGFTYATKDGIVVIKKKDQKTRTLEGKVVDEQGGELPGVTVLILGKERNIGTMTDADGAFSLGLPEGDVTIRLSFVGMQTLEIYTGKLNLDKVHTFKLKPDSKQLEEVVVTGYAKISKNSFTGTSVTVTADQLMSVSKTNVLGALQTFDPSFRIAENNLAGSNPNNVPELYIRGRSGIGTTQLDAQSLSKTSLKNNPNLPTFIMDGFEVSVQKVYDMDINRIESMTILKDAAATALYGSRAANGVVVVTTVAPKPGELRVTYNFNAGVELPDLSDYNLCNAWEKVEVERLSGKYIAESGDPGMQLEKDIAYNDLVNEVRRGVQTDWLAQPLHNVFNHSHSMNVSSGVESIRYSLDLNYGTHNGAMIDSYRDNVGVGLNLDYRNKSWLQVMNSISFNVTKSQDSPYGNFDTYAKLQPYWAPYSNDGELLETLKDGKTTNPLYRAEKLGSFSGRSRLNDLTNNFSINIYFTKNFSFKGQLSMTRTDSETKSFSDPKDPSFKGSPTRERGTLTTSSDKGFTWNTNAMFYFNKGIDKHFINATAGLNVQESHSKTTAIEYRGFQLSNLNSPTYAAEQTRKSAVSSDKSRLLGMLASLNYSYNNVYLLDASFRLDGSSKFGEDKRFAPFWSVGAGVNFHNYSWLKDNWLVSLLRVRGTYGVTGNVNFPAYAAISTYKTSDKWYYDTPSNTLIALGNPKLTWACSMTVL